MDKKRAVRLKLFSRTKIQKIAKQAKSKKHPGLHDDHRRPRLHQHPAAPCHPHRNRQLIGSNSVVATFNHQSIHPTPSNYSRNSPGPGPGNKNKNEWIELILWGARRLHRRLLAKISPMASSWIGYWFHVNIGAGSVRSKTFQSIQGGDGNNRLRKCFVDRFKEAVPKFQAPKPTARSLAHFGSIMINTAAPTQMIRLPL